MFMLTVLSKSLTMAAPLYQSYDGKVRTNSNIEWHRPQSTENRVEAELIKKSQRAVQHTKDPLEKLRLLCLSRGSTGIMVLCRYFRKMDDFHSKPMNKEEFKHGLKETGLELTEQEADQLFDKLDTANNGFIRLDEFLEHIRPPMSDNRRAIVAQAFRKLDKKGDGMVTVQEIRDVYSALANPRYKSGEDSALSTLNTFLAHFEQQGIADGTVTMEEFLNYYSGISVSIDEDGYFDLMMRQEYQL